MKSTLLSASCAMFFAGFALAAPACAQSTSSGTMTSNGSSTGVGNAGSFGIASGTSNSTSNATATSNGVQDSSTHNSADSSTRIKTVSVQELQASNSGNYIVPSAGAGSTSSPPTGSNVVQDNAFSNFSGILANGWNTGSAATAQAGTNIAVNGNFGRN